MPRDDVWIVAGLAGAVVFAVAALYAHPAAMAAGAAGCVAAGFALYEPRLIGPMLALALPLEISKLCVPVPADALRSWAAACRRRRSSMRGGSSSRSRSSSGSFGRSAPAPTSCRHRR